jgi:eukaryotic-like serine/threonine-protein kinase
VNNGAVYVATDIGGVYAFDANSGAVRWSIHLPSDDAVSYSDQNKVLPAYANGVVYVGTNRGTLYALDAADGSIRWTFAVKRSVVATPVVANDMVFVLTADGYLHAIAEQA